MGEREGHHMQKIIICAVTIIVAISFVLAAQPPVGTEPNGFDELTKQKGLFKKTLANPEVDFARYDSICPVGVQLDFQVRAASAGGEVTGSRVRKTSENLAPPDREVQTRYREVIGSSLAKELERREVLRLVVEPGPKTLLLRAAVVDMVSRIPSLSGSPDELRGKLVAEGTLVFDLIDAETGRIVAHCSERRRIKKGDGASQDSGSDTLWDDVGAWAHQAAADLCQELERLHR